MVATANAQSAHSSTFGHSGEALQALNSTLSASSTRLAGSISTRKPKVPKPVYPEKYNQKYRIPTGIEEQPF